MSGPSDYRLILPENWHRIGLEPGAREPGIARLTDRQFRGTDNAPHLKRQARDELLKTARNAYGNGGIEMYVSLQTAAGLPLSASLIVTLTPLHADEAVNVPPQRLAQSLSGGGAQVTLAGLPAGPAVRVRRRTAPGRGSVPGYRPAVTNLDIHVPVPGSGAYLILSFSTPLDPLADAMAGLFDAIAGTLRWIP
jgi:hypothetical protein